MSTRVQVMEARAGTGVQVLGWASAWPWMALAAVGLTALYWDALASLLVAWQRPEYSHGPLVPLVTAYMVLRELHRRPPLSDAGSRTPGLVFVTLGLMLGLLGNLARVQDIGTYGLILAIGGFILILAGTREGLRFWPGWVHLVFMLPLPQFLSLHLSTGLQSISSQIGVGLIDVLGIPVLLDGNIIDLGTYRLQVAEACSGLNYLFPLLSFGWLVALLYVGPNWHRAVLFLSTIPIAILMNAFRIGVIGILVNRYGIEQAEGFLHAFEGWVVFMASVAILFGEAWLLQRLAAGGRACAGVLDLDHGGMLGTLRKLPKLRASAALAAASMMVLSAGLLWQSRPEAQPAPVPRESLALFPMQLGGWRGQTAYLDPQTLEVLGADDHLNASFVKGAHRVELTLTYYHALNGGNGGIHSPEVCLPAGGWEVSEWSRTPVPVAGEVEPGLIVNRAVIQKGSYRQLVYYWFEQRGTRTASDYAAKFLSLRDTVATGRSDGGLVRLVTPIGHTEGLASAEARLAAIMQQIVPMLPRYFPPA